MRQHCNKLMDSIQQALMIASDFEGTDSRTMISINAFKILPLANAWISVKRVACHRCVCTTVLTVTTSRLRVLCTVCSVSCLSSSDGRLSPWHTCDGTPFTFIIRKAFAVAVQQCGIATIRRSLGARQSCRLNCNASTDSQVTATIRRSLGARVAA